MARRIAVFVVRQSRFNVTFHALKFTVDETTEAFRTCRTEARTLPRPRTSRARKSFLFKRNSRTVAHHSESLVDEKSNARYGTALFGTYARLGPMVGFAVARTGRDRPDQRFPARVQTANGSARRSRTFNKNLSTPFERSSPRSPVRHSYVPIGRTRSGDGAAARLPLAAAGRTVNGCGRADQSRCISAANIPPTSLF